MARLLLFAKEKFQSSLVSIPDSVSTLFHLGTIEHWLALHWKGLSFLFNKIGKFFFSFLKVQGIQKKGHCKRRTPSNPPCITLFKENEFFEKRGNSSNRKKRRSATPICRWLGWYAIGRFPPAMKSNRPPWTYGAPPGRSSIPV